MAIDFVDVSVLEELKDWQLDRALTRVEEELRYARENLHSLNSWNSLQEDIDQAQADLEELATCKGKIRAEITRRHPYRNNF